MEQREIELVRIGFLKGIDCMENHPEDDDYDSIYFDRALDIAEEKIDHEPNRKYRAECRRYAIDVETLAIPITDREQDDVTKTMFDLLHMVLVLTNDIETVPELKKVQELRDQEQAFMHCMEPHCMNPATKDYNGHNHFVCNYHYEKLSDYFDEEYD